MQVKLLDYGKNNPFGQIVGRVKYLAWPVYAYRVTLPQVQNDESHQNPFETLVLNFLSIDPQITDTQLATQTCLPEHLIHGIICRLQDRGFLDEYRVIVEEKRKNWQNSLEVSSENYVTVVVFQDLFSKRLLPFLHYINEHPLKKITDECIIKRHHLLPHDIKGEYPIPTPKEVIVALREMKTLESHRNQGTSSPPLQQIQRLSMRELYYLACPIAIQQSDGDFRIGDPFGRGYSAMLEKVFSEILEKDKSVYLWFKNWQKGLYDGSTEQADRQEKYLFDTPDLKSKYSHLIYNLIPAYGKEFRSIRKIYASLEWALFYFCKQFSYEKYLGVLQFLSPIEMPTKIANLSEQLGFKKYERGFCYVKPGKILDFRNGQAEMPMGIALTLMLTEDASARQTVLKIAHKHPDFFDRIHSIKTNRDRIEHGSKQNFSDVALTDDSFMMDIVSTLLPEIQFESSTSRQSSLGSGRFFDQNFAGRINIQDYFGIRDYNQMGENLQQRLISAESFWCGVKNNENCDDAMSFVCNLYAATQISFKRHLYQNLPPNMSDEQILPSALKKAIEAGFSELPERIKSTRIAMVRQTIQEQDQTLGAATLAFLIISDPEVLTMVFNRQPSFLQDVNSIITSRGHGNQVLPLSVYKVEELRKSTYTTIKTLLEV